MRPRPSHKRPVVAFAFAALFALSGTGVVVAHAESDLAPSADELFGGGGVPARQLNLPTGDISTMED